VALAASVARCEADEAGSPECGGRKTRNTLKKGKCKTDFQGHNRRQPDGQREGGPGKQHGRQRVRRAVVVRRRKKGRGEGVRGQDSMGGKREDDDIQLLRRNGNGQDAKQGKKTRGEWGGHPRRRRASAIKRNRGTGNINTKSEKRESKN